MANAPAPKKATYVSGGQVLDSPPLSARLSRGVDSLYNFLGLYFVSLFSMDPYTAAQGSRFNTRGPGRSAGGVGGGSRGAVGRGGSGGGTGGGGSGGGVGRRLGTVDDVRGPECGSCA